MFIADYLFDQLSTLDYTSHSCPRGRLQHVSSFYENANIIAFVGAACLKASDPLLIQMASDLRGNVAVVEICSTGTEPGEVEQCRMVRGVKEKV